MKSKLWKKCSIKPSAEQLALLKKAGVLSEYDVSKISWRFQRFKDNGSLLKKVRFPILDEIDNMTYLESVIFSAHLISSVRGR